MGLVSLQFPEAFLIVVIVVPQAPCKGEATFNGQHRLHLLTAHHLLVVVARPALHHHQHVEGSLMLSVVGLEIVFRMGDKAFYLG